jgi:hypothetical protein
VFDWIKRAFNIGVGIGNVLTGAAFRNAIALIFNVIQTNYQYWHTVAGHVGDGWQELTRTLLYLRNGMTTFMFAQYQFDYLILKRDIPWLSNWIAWLGGKVHNDLIALQRREDKEISAGLAAQHAYTRSVLLWVLVHVLAFLYNLVKRIFGWIDGIGATMWHYFTHLADFAELLIMFLVASLERHAWQIGKLLGTFFLSLVVHNMVKFAKLLEDIVNAVL